MSSNTIFVWQSVNLFCGDHDPLASKHLTLQELKLPTLQEIQADHHAGGSRFAIEVGVGAEKLESSFKLGGFDPSLMGQFGAGSGKPKIYTAYSEILDKKTGRSIEGKAVMEGYLGKNEGDAWQAGEFAGHDYSINGLTHYEFSFDEKVLFRWDFWTNENTTPDGDRNAERNRILRIPQ